ncbi:hypothetical protein GOBAR_AA39194 [Gossypium barbadense]|uniref:RING-type E3 ubiquitin transferase n=1 Tax=Gossypium barbadense TaxID=3634 RepID=A0A2P5Q2R0_GOSBA|nr:hypothetical protein GOBAR_DD34346 [Gossypium barbadense]PPR81521.1 hypothetical protein GOBAR_AA39194 [Gossypium barbadense]
MASTAASNRSSSDDITDVTTSLLSSQGSVLREDSATRGSVRRQSLREAARFLRRASSRRLMREPSMLVRETAAEQLEERHSDWAYSKPVVVLDIIWNFAFVAAAVGVLVLSWNERPSMPLRLWIIGYALQCLLHMVCVCVEYRRRRRQRSMGYRSFNTGEEGALSPRSRVDSEQYVTLAHLEEDGGRWPSNGWWLPSALLEGASKEDIDQLPKYKFRKIGNDDKVAGDVQGSIGGVMTECGTDSPMERALSEDDAECCICLSSYDDGVELRELPCGHHFHCACVDKWLHINATCPLCKYNILKSSTHEEV